MGPQDPKDVTQAIARDLTGMVGELAALKTDAAQRLEGTEHEALRLHWRSPTRLLRRRWWRRRVRLDEGRQGREGGVQDERLREDAKQLLRVAYEREVALGDVGVGVDLGAAAQERGIRRDSPHLTTLTDYMGVAGWVEPDAGARADADDRLYRITERGMEVLREAIG